MVTDEPDLADLVRDLGCDVLPDEGAGDLNRALQRAVLALPAPRTVSPRCCGDLPCLLPEDLEHALRRGAGQVASWRMPRAPAPRSLAAGPGDRSIALRSPVPCRARGCRRIVEITLDVSSLRRDVDTADDLAAARMLGVGERHQRGARPHLTPDLTRLDT